MTYACHPAPGVPAQGSWYEVENTNGTVMYGKPGGEWKQAESAREARAEPRPADRLLNRRSRRPLIG